MSMACFLCDVASNIFVDSTQCLKVGCTGKGFFWPSDELDGVDNTLADAADTASPLLHQPQAKKPNSQQFLVDSEHGYAWI